MSQECQAQARWPASSRFNMTDYYQELLAQRDELNQRIDEARRTEVAEAIRRVKDIIQEQALVHY